MESYFLGKCIFITFLRCDNGIVGESGYYRSIKDDVCNLLSSSLIVHNTDFILIKV